MAQEVVSSQDVTIEFDAKRCVHSRNCVLNRPDVFVPNVQGDWIHPECATADEVLEIAHNCPSGAIQCHRPDGTSLEQAPVVNLCTVRENGPLAVHAPLKINGKPDGFRATLCRCGLSANKPYCDQSHVAANFQASGEPPSQDSDALAQRNGELSIEPLANGPLHVSGNLELVSGTGRTLNRVSDTYLCRCGHSGNKPYCDGSHARVGFKAD